MKNEKFKINELTDLTEIYEINEGNSKFIKINFHQVINDDVLVFKKENETSFMLSVELFEIFQISSIRKRTVYFPDEKMEKSSKNNNIETIKFLNGYFTKSKSMKVQINKKNKLISITQNNSKDLFYLMQLILIYGN